MHEHYRTCKHWARDGRAACGQVRSDGSTLTGRAELHVRLTDDPRRVSCRKCVRIVERAGLAVPLEGVQLPLPLPLP